jgi:hypothetical protein
MFEDGYVYNRPSLKDIYASSNVSIYITLWNPASFAWQMGNSWLFLERNNLSWPKSTVSQLFYKDGMP